MESFARAVRKSAGLNIEARVAGTLGPVATRARLDALDLLRGLVMVLMVLDHGRDFIHADALRYDPLDLTRTTVVLFFTRWITHYCAPAFVLLAGIGTYLQRIRGATTADVSRFLLTRGLWLVVLEFTVVRTGAFWNLDYSFLGLMQVIWAIGVSMVVLGALVHLPVGAVAAFGVAMIALHNLFDGVQVPGWQGPGTAAPAVWGKVWIVLHQSGELLPIVGSSGPAVFVMYPLVPWIGVIAVGYACGTFYALERERRVRILRRLGVGMTLAFVVLRALNVYGDPAPWSMQPTVGLTLLSFLNTTKYPASLLFLLMTLGPILLLLAWLETIRTDGRPVRALIVFGRVPLFFYLLQWPLVHALSLLLALFAGTDTAYLFASFPEILAAAPADAGFGLSVVYVCWAIAIVMLFPLCLWFAGLKRRSTARWLRYM